jgi:hypothetical protein
LENPGLSVAGCRYGIPHQPPALPKDLVKNIIEMKTQPSHRKRMETIENKGFLTIPNAMGWSVALKTPSGFQNTNKINGFVHVSYGMALK